MNNRFNREQVLPPASEWLNGAWDKILGREENLLITEYSSLWLIQDKSRLYTLDRLASLLKGGAKGVINAWGRSIRLSKKDSSKLIEDLREQSKKLRSLAQSYELIATALSVGEDNFEEIVDMNDTIKNARHNPF